MGEDLNQFSTKGVRPIQGKLPSFGLWRKQFTMVM